MLEAVLPDGTRRTLIKIDDWDFNWQGTYEFATAVAIPKGTKIEMVAHFDNSEKNPKNPSKPPVEVRWGEQTTDEMCIGFLQLTRDGEKLENRAPARFRAAASEEGHGGGESTARGVRSQTRAMNKGQRGSFAPPHTNPKRQRGGHSRTPPANVCEV